MNFVASLLLLLQLLLPSAVAFSVRLYPTRMIHIRTWSRQNHRRIHDQVDQDSCTTSNRKSLRLFQSQPPPGRRRGEIPPEDEQGQFYRDPGRDVGYPGQPPSQPQQQQYYQQSPGRAQNQPPPPQPMPQQQPYQRQQQMPGPPQYRERPPLNPSPFQEQYLRQPLPPPKPQNYDPYRQQYQQFQQQPPPRPPPLTQRETQQQPYPPPQHPQSQRRQMVVGHDDPSNNQRQGMSDASTQGASHTVQGGSLRTYGRRPDDQYSVKDEHLHYSIQSDSNRPIQANLEVWQSPNYAPQTLKAYSQDGTTHPWNVSFQSPNNAGNVMSVRNTGPLEFPIQAKIDRQDNTLMNDTPDRSAGFGTQARVPVPRENDARHVVVHDADEAAFHRQQRQEMNARNGILVDSRTIQGGDIDYFKVQDDPVLGTPHEIQRMEVILETDGMPLNANVELWQGPGNIKQIAEVYSDNGLTKPFRAVIETPSDGTTRTISVLNTGPVSYPLVASVRPLLEEGDPPRNHFADHPSSSGRLGRLGTANPAIGSSKHPNDRPKLGPGITLDGGPR